MAEFVHLHLHTVLAAQRGVPESGNCSMRRSLSPRAGRDRRGNLFSAITFRDRARQHGIKPILGCEVYVAPGSRLTRGDSNIRVREPPLILLAETNEGFRNCRETNLRQEASTTSRAFDKELSASHSKGLIALGGCLKGEFQRAPRRPVRARGEGRRAYREVVGAGQFFLELQFRESTPRGRRACCRSPATSGSHSSAPTTCTTSPGQLAAHDILLCMRHRGGP